MRIMNRFGGLVMCGMIVVSLAAGSTALGQEEDREGDVRTRPLERRQEGVESLKPEEPEHTATLADMLLDKGVNMNVTTEDGAVTITLSSGDDNVMQRVREAVAAILDQREARPVLGEDMEVTNWPDQRRIERLEPEGVDDPDADTREREREHGQEGGRRERERVDEDQGNHQYHPPAQ